MIYIVMGVSGAGKSFIGQKLAHELDLPFYDADNFHSAKNVAKMKSGQPLNDADRRPWLEKLANKMERWDQKKGAVLACSALKHAYRNILSHEDATVSFIYLKAGKKLIKKRLSKRSGHFMSSSLLDSQFEALEEAENALTVKASQSPDEIIEEIMKKI